MGTLQGPIICRPISHRKQHTLLSVPQKNAAKLGFLHPSKFWGYKCKVFLHRHSNRAKSTIIRNTFSSSSDGSGSTAENYSEKDEDYVISSVVEAVEVRSGSDGFMIKMRDGKHVRCVHNSPQGGYLPDYAPHPAIVLKMEDGSNLLLPIIVLEMPSVLLMAAVRNVQMARPTVYQVVKDMIEKMGYEVQLVRVTRRVHEAYFAKLYLAKVGDDSDRISLDLRPSDAINIAVRCKVPIQVNRNLALSDGMKIVEPQKVTSQGPHSDGLLFAELDKPDGQPCMETVEFNLVRNMLLAAVEERYKDAAQWRDKLTQLRSKKKNWA